MEGRIGVISVDLKAPQYSPLLPLLVFKLPQSVSSNHYCLRYPLQLKKVILTKKIYGAIYSDYYILLLHCVCFFTVV